LHNLTSLLLVQDTEKLCKDRVMKDVGYLFAKILNIISGSESRLRGSQEFLDIQEGEDEDDEEENDDFQPLPCFSGARDKDMDKVFLFDDVLKQTVFSFCLLLLVFHGLSFSSLSL
jgi:hypothetical protein